MRRMWQEMSKKNKKFKCERCGLCCIAAPCLIDLADLPTLAKFLTDVYTINIEHVPDEERPGETVVLAQVVALKPTACAFFQHGADGMACMIYDQTAENFEDGCELPKVKKLI